MAYTAPTFETTAVINSTTLFKDYDDQVQILIEDVGQYLEDESNAIYQDLGTIVTDGIINDTSAGSLTTYSSNKINTIADTKQATLVSGTNIKTINSTTLLGSGDISVQATLVSGTNIKTINSTSLLGSGDIAISSGISLATANSYDIGVNQTWQNVTANRAIGTTYTNSTGKPILISVKVLWTGSSSNGSILIDNSVYVSMTGFASASGSFYGNSVAVIPNGSTYKCTYAGSYSEMYWAELR